MLIKNGNSACQLEEITRFSCSSINSIWLILDFNSQVAMTEDQVQVITQRKVQGIIRLMRLTESICNFR